MSFYKSRKWKSKRQAILRRDGYVCRECQRYGKMTPATTVHHIIPIERNKELRLNSNNLISLCDACHERMHDRTNGGLSALGERWAERVSPLPSDHKKY